MALIPHSTLYIGLMSGTSLDGVDAVLVDFAEARGRIVGYASAPFPAALAAEFLALNSSGADELHRAALAANALARLYADVVARLLGDCNVRSADICAIGAHGQTVRHRPQEFDGVGYTLQANQPALLAELCGITVVADFRSRDVAAQGQGAPLVPPFHAAYFGQAQRAVAVLNVGGIANITLLDPQAAQPVQGFDCGPGNALMDAWCQHHTGKPYDDAGAWAASGTVNAALLERMLQEPFFAKAPPRSTGRDLFHWAWLMQHLASSTIPAAYVQATLLELTARVAAQSLLDYAPQCEKLIVCGGGALNVQLMQRLQALLHPRSVVSSQSVGLHPLQVEAAAFAWLAQQTMRGQTASLSAVTGARGARILGAIYQA